MWIVGTSFSSSFFSSSVLWLATLHPGTYVSPQITDEDLGDKILTEGLKPWALGPMALNSPALPVCAASHCSQGLFFLISFYTLCSSPVPLETYIFTFIGLASLHNTFFKKLYCVLYPRHEGHDLICFPNQILRRSSHSVYRVLPLSSWIKNWGVALKFLLSFTAYIQANQHVLEHISKHASSGHFHHCGMGASHPHSDGGWM